jgi:hypothetical protein
MTRTRRPAVPPGDPILTSKITAPGVPDWAVQRPRITKLIAQGVRWCPLTVVTGPPGAGKTMAVALWAAGPGRVAWVGLDEYDNRPGAFWSYILAALSGCGVAVPRALPAAGRGRAAGHGFLLRLAAALAGQDRPVMLVLDDLHLLTDREALQGLNYLLRNSGAGLRVVICSRMDPLLPLHIDRTRRTLKITRTGRDGRGQGERTGERVADRVSGQHAADGQVDPVDDRQANPDSPPQARYVMAEIPWRDQHQPHRDQGRAGPGPSGSWPHRRPGGRRHHLRSHDRVRGRPLSTIRHDHQRGRRRPRDVCSRPGEARRVKPPG